MSNRRLLSNLGSHVYGLAAIAHGLIGLAWGDFATVWQPVPASALIVRRLPTSSLSVCFREERRCNGAGPLRLVLSC